jgi:hypothetical protein
MAAIPALREQELRASDGFRVETPRGRLGVVEEVWLGEHGAPQALAVRTVDGRHGLLLAEEIAAVHPDEERVVVEEPTLLELEPPRLDGDRADGTGERLSASWTTTGDVLPLPEPPTRLHLPFAHARLDAPAPSVFVERPLWQTVAILYGSIALLAALLIGLTFLLAALVAGHAY